MTETVEKINLPNESILLIQRYKQKSTHTHYKHQDMTT